MWRRSFRLPLNAALAAVSAVLLTSTGAAADDSWPIDDSGAQPLDATMRSQFGKVGSAYHLYLGEPVVFDPVTIDVGANKSALMGGFVALDQKWFQARVQNLIGKLQLDPTRLAIFLTRNVALYAQDPANCCVLGGHGAGHVTGGLGGPVNGYGNQPVQTFVWSSWL